MYRKIEALGARLLSLVVPHVDANASVGTMECGSWPACWQCNRAYGGPCSYNAPCGGCRNSSGGWTVVCDC